MSSSSPPAGCGVGSCWASFGVTALPFSWGICGFLLRVLQLATLLGFHTLLPQVSWPPPIGVLHPWRVLQPFWLQFAGLLLRLCLVVGLEGSLLRHLVFSHVPCSSSGPAACAAFPAAGYLGVFLVTGCLSFCFPGDVGWASALPFFFCVRVLQLWWGLLGLTVRSPCCPSLTLGWVCFWPAVSQAFVGCEGGLGCPLWFVNLFLCVVLHLFWGWGGLVTGLWPLLRLLGFGLFWCLVAPSWRLSLWPHPLLLSPWISSLGVCSDLG